MFRIFFSLSNLCGCGNNEGGKLRITNVNIIDFGLLFTRLTIRLKAVAFLSANHNPFAVRMI